MILLHLLVGAFRRGNKGRCLNLVKNHLLRHALVQATSLLVVLTWNGQINDILSSVLC